MTAAQILSAVTWICSTLCVASFVTACRTLAWTVERAPACRHRPPASPPRRFRRLPLVSGRPGCSRCSATTRGRGLARRLLAHLGAATVPARRRWAPRRSHRPAACTATRVAVMASHLLGIASENGIANLTPPGHRRLARLLRRGRPGRQAWPGPGWSKRTGCCRRRLDGAGGSASTATTTCRARGRPRSRLLKLYGCRDSGQASPRRGLKRMAPGACLARRLGEQVRT
jgi:hypothetical protein